MKLAHEQIFNLVDSSVIAGFSSRILGNMSLSYGDTSHSLKNRQNFLVNLGIDYQSLVCAKQIHSSNTRYVTEKDTGSGALTHDTSIEATDAFITDKKDVPLAVFTADCLSIFLFDPLIPAIGLVHAGWRSSKERILAKTINLMQETFNTKAVNLHVSFGPDIRNCCCEVAKDFMDFFPKEVSQKQGRFYLDLVKVNKIQAQDCGVKEMNMRDSQICTSCRNEDFFSFRKEGKSCGRLMSVIMLK